MSFGSRALRALVGACAAAACVAGCGGSGHSGRPRVTVTPAASVEDQPVHIRVRGLSPHQGVSLDVSSTDAKGVHWVSTARFTASAAGVVDPRRTAPRSGAYTGVWGMGLLSMARPIGPSPAGAYFWAREPMRFTVTVKTAGKTRASTTFTRRFSNTALRTRDLSLRRVGFIGQFVYPTGASRRPAILLLGGSEGGLPGLLASGALAAQGYAVLALGYFKLPGLPHRLQRIPLEYFRRALRWLRRQPQVDPKRVAVLGASRGSEAALLSGAYFPHLVHAVIAMVPSDAAICSFPGCLGPAWTFHGHAVPFTVQFNNPYPSDHPDAVIPVQRIQGPLFLACGTDDMVWDSCAYARAIMHHLNRSHDRFPHVLYAYPGAGHSVGSFVPDEPMDPALFSDQHIQADQQALVRDWPRLLRFLAAFGGH